MTVSQGTLDAFAVIAADGVMTADRFRTLGGVGLLMAVADLGDVVPDAVAASLGSVASSACDGHPHAIPSVVLARPTYARAARIIGRRMSTTLPA